MKHSILLAAIAATLFFASSGVRAANYTWTGSAVDNTWATATNWRSGGVVASATPTAGDDAIFTDLAAGSGAFSVDAGTGQSTGRLSFGVNNATASAPTLTRVATLVGGPITLSGFAAGGGNVFGLSVSSTVTGQAIIDSDLILAGGPADGLRFNVESSLPTILNGAISDAGGAFGIHKVGAGTLVLNGNTSYSGATTIRTGTFELNGTASGGGTYNLVAGGRLAGDANITGNINVTGASASISPGKDIGTLAVTGDVSITGGSLTVGVDGTGSGSQDQLLVSGLLTINATARLNITTAAPLDDEAYVIATYGTLAGNFSNANIAGLPEGYELQSGYGGQNQLALVAVPEPVLLGFAGLAMLTLLRRSQKQ